MQIEVNEENTKTVNHQHHHDHDCGYAREQDSTATVNLREGPRPTPVPPAHGAGPNSPLQRPLQPTTTTRPRLTRRQTPRVQGQFTVCDAGTWWSTTASWCAMHDGTGPVRDRGHASSAATLSDASTGSHCRKQPVRVHTCIFIILRCDGRARHCRWSGGVRSHGALIWLAVTALVPGISAWLCSMRNDLTKHKHKRSDATPRNAISQRVQTYGW